MTEKIPHEIEHSREIAEFALANEQLADPTTRRDYFEHLGEDDFLDTVQQIASLIRTGDSNAQQHFDGKEVSHKAFDVPDQREKEQLLRDTWQTAQKFLHDRTLSDEDALEYAALTAAGGLLYAHPFVDGNGRTSRTLSYLMIQGNASQEELEALLTQSSDKAWHATPPDIAAPLEVDQEEGLLDGITWQARSPAEQSDTIVDDIASSTYKTYIAYVFLRDGDKAVRAIAEQCMTTEDGTRKVLNGEKFIEMLVNDHDAGLAYADELLKLRRKAEAEYVHRFLKAVEDSTPRQPKAVNAGMIDTSRGGSEYVKEVRAATARRFGQLATKDGKLSPVEELSVLHQGQSRIRRERF